MAETPEVRLWHLADSHFNEKARWALDLKRLPHRRRAVPPGAHMLVALALTGRPTLPVLVVGRERTSGSAAIVARLEALRAEPALLPAEPAARAAALGLEAFLGAELAPHIRRYSLFHLLRDTELCLAMTAPHAGAATRRALAATLPGLRRVLFARYGIDGATAAVARRRTLAALDRLEAELGPSGYLVGDRFTVADLAGAAMLGPLLRPAGSPWPALPWLPAPLAELRDEVRRRPAGAWAQTMYARHRGDGEPPPPARRR